MSEEINNKAQTPLEAAIDEATGYKPGDETKPAEAREASASVKEKRDWVYEAYECFIKNAVDSDPTDPVKAISAYFEKNATDELKAKATAEGKTAEGCWKFVEAVARKALGGHSGHVDPVAVYAIAMHYFQDVPKDWDAAKKGKVKTKSENAKETEAKTKAEAKKPVAKPKARKSGKKCGKTQGFFFDLLETEPVGPDEGNGGEADAAQDVKEAGDAE